jgi:hypothetical protein
MDEPFKVTGNNIGLAFTGTGEIAIPAAGNDDVVAMRGENGHLVVGPGVTLTEGTIFVRGKNNVIDINGKVNVTGNQAAIQTTGSDTNTGNIINVNEPAVITSADLAIYAAGDANYNINGGSITGKTAIYQKGGKLTVTDGTYGYSFPFLLTQQDDGTYTITTTNDVTVPMEFVDVDRTLTNILGFEGSYTILDPTEE